MTVNMKWLKWYDMKWDELKWVWTRLLYEMSWDEITENEERNEIKKLNKIQWNKTKCNKMK